MSRSGYDSCLLDPVAVSCGVVTIFLLLYICVYVHLYADGIRRLFYNFFWYVVFFVYT